MQSQEEESVQLSQVVWSKVLKSQGAYLNYRRSVRSSVHGSSAVTFLLTDNFFPRSQQFCFRQIYDVLVSLPRSEKIEDKINTLLANTRGVDSSDDLNEGFRQYLNDIQLAIIDLNDQISETWFDFQQGEAA